MKLNELIKPNNGPKEIILISGNICSGKGTYCAQQYPGYKVIGVSSVVRQLSGFNKRSDLGTTKDLDNVIANHIIEEILNSDNDKIVVDGIRQMTILEKLQRYFKDQIKDIIWLDVPHEELKSRFEKRNAGKDDINFDKAIQSDKDLGIGDVENYIRTNHRVVNNY